MLEVLQRRKAKRNEHRNDLVPRKLKIASHEAQLNRIEKISCSKDEIAIFDNQEK